MQYLLNLVGRLLSSRMQRMKSESQEWPPCFTSATTTPLRSGQPPNGPV
jgi:hypothetical protein